MKYKRELEFRGQRKQFMTNSDLNAPIETSKHCVLPKPIAIKISSEYPCQI